MLVQRLKERILSLQKASILPSLLNVDVQLQCGLCQGFAVELRHMSWKTGTQ